MKKWFPIVALFFFACSNKDANTAGFKLNGTYKNAANQQVFLEQIDFASKKINVIDTANLKDGAFSFSSKATEQGLYRIRTADSGMFVFINDAPMVTFSGDKNDQSLVGSSFSGNANNILKKFILDIDLMNKTYRDESMALKQMQQGKSPDSSIQAKTALLASVRSNFEKYVKGFLDTTTNPITALYSLDFASTMNPGNLDKSVKNLAAKFPSHTGIINYVTAFNAMMNQYKKDQQQMQQTQKANGMPSVGDVAPDFSMNDVAGNAVALSSFKGKYVLVDFWASWCGPCRGENPSVVAAYNKFKDKNFTILGVSLDDKKENWVKAIADDKLTWTQVSDLQNFNSKAVVLYKFGEIGIPYNVLVDPQGKIIATSLRGTALDEKLAEVLK